MSKTLKTGAAYIRVSTDDQLDYSPESQLKAIRDYAKRNGIIIPDEYVYQDDGISGRKAEKRPGFQKMISDAKTKPTPFQIILVWKFSRFARNREDSIVYKSMLRKQCGIDVVSIAEPLSDDKTSLLIEALLEAMDEYYSINLGEEVKRGMTEKATRGEVLSVPPYGYEIKNKEYVIKEDEAKIVKYIFESYAKGKAARGIVEECNAMGARSHRGNCFELRTIEYILNNPVYIGKIRWNPLRKTKRNYDDPDLIIVDGKHERIITNELWEKAQEISKKKKSTHKKSEKPFAFNNVLQGIVRCSACGSTLIKNNKYLQCNKYIRGVCTVSHSMPYAKTVKSIFEQVKKDFELGTFQNMRKIEKDDIEKDLIKSQIIREEKMLIRIKEAFLAGIDTMEEYKESKSNIMESIKMLKSKLPSEKNEKEDLAKKLVKDNKKIISKLFNDKISPEEKNNILKSFLEKIVFNKKSKELVFYYYL